MCLVILRHCKTNEIQLCQKQNTKLTILQMNALKLQKDGLLIGLMTEFMQEDLLKFQMPIKLINFCQNTLLITMSIDLNNLKLF